MNQKKAQGSLEFLLLLIFILTIVSLVMYFLGMLSVDLSKQKEKDEVDNLAESIKLEFDIMEKVTGGYERKFLIEPYEDDYNFSINSSYLIIEDLKHSVEGESENVYYYGLRNNASATFIEEDNLYNDGINETYIYFQKDYEEDYVGISLN